MASGYRLHSLAILCMALSPGGIHSADPAPLNSDQLKGYELLKRQFTSGERVPEFVEMLWAIDKEEMGPGKGWWKPGQSRYGWKWLAERFDADRDGVIIPLEFTGSPELFGRLDRIKDLVLSEKDFNWSEPRAKETGGGPWSQVMGKAMGALMKMPPKETLVCGLFNGEIGSIFEGPKVGEQAPDFVLPTEDGKRRVQLAEFHGRKPVVLIFGSFT